MEFRGREPNCSPSNTTHRETSPYNTNSENCQCSRQQWQRPHHCERPATHGAVANSSATGQAQPQIIASATYRPMGGGPKGKPESAPAQPLPTLLTSPTTTPSHVDPQQQLPNLLASPMRISGSTSATSPSFSEHFVNMTDFYPGPPVLPPWDTPLDIRPRPDFGSSHIEYNSGHISQLLLETYPLLIHHGLAARSSADGHQGPLSAQPDGHSSHPVDIVQGPLRPPLPQDFFGAAQPPERDARDTNKQPYSHAATVGAISAPLPTHALRPSPARLVYVSPTFPNGGPCVSIAQRATPCPGREIRCTTAASIPTVQPLPAVSPAEDSGREEGFYDTSIICLKEEKVAEENENEEDQEEPDEEGFYHMIRLRGF